MTSADEGHGYELSREGALSLRHRRGTGTRLPHGYRAMVERHLDLAQRLAGLVDAAPELERSEPRSLAE